LDDASSGEPNPRRWLLADAFRAIFERIGVETVESHEARGQSLGGRLEKQSNCAARPRLARRPQNDAEFHA
jgi:hypothetical protein